MGIINKTTFKQNINMNRSSILAATIACAQAINLKA